MNSNKIEYPSIIIDGRGDIKLAFEDAKNMASSYTTQARIEIIEPEKDKKSISIDQARELRKKVTLKVDDDTTRVFIIKYISLMGDTAQNALLKTLEELGDNLVVFLPVSNPSSILPTILSRSRLIKSNPSISTNDKKKEMVDSALLDHTLSVSIDSSDMTKASEFLKKSVADRLNDFKSYTDDRDNMRALLESLRVLCISTMRATATKESKTAWSHKIIIADDLLQKMNSNAPAKILLLGAASRL